MPGRRTPLPPLAVLVAVLLVLAIDYHQVAHQECLLYLYHLERFQVGVLFLILITLHGELMLLIFAATVMFDFQGQLQSWFFAGSSEVPSFTHYGLFVSP